MTRYGLFFRFSDGVIETTHYSVLALTHARDNGWELIGLEPQTTAEQIEDVRHSDEHRWDGILKERR